jgi:hypothetical protein
MIFARCKAPSHLVRRMDETYQTLKWLLRESRDLIHEGGFEGCSD